VWDTTHEARKPTHYIQTINSVARVAWKPGAGFEVASCSLSADFRIYVWHIERPYIPDLCFEKHDNVVSGRASSAAVYLHISFDIAPFKGIVWGIKGNLFSCSRDQTAICHNITRDSYKLRDRLPKTGMSFTVQTDMAMAANEARGSAADATSKSDVERMERSRNLQRSGPAAMRHVSALSTSIGVVSTDRVGSKVFDLLARHYVISNGAKHSCLVNSKVGIYTAASMFLICSTVPFSPTLFRSPSI
jgi:hypothetical protein